MISFSQRFLKSIIIIAVLILLIFFSIFMMINRDRFIPRTRTESTKSLENSIAFYGWTNDANFQLWKIEDEIRTELYSWDEGWAISLSPDHRWLAIVDDTNFSLIDLQKKQQTKVHEFKHREYIGKTIWNKNSTSFIYSIFSAPPIGGDYNFASTPDAENLIERIELPSLSQTTILRRFDILENIPSEIHPLAFNPEDQSRVYISASWEQEPFLERLYNFDLGSLGATLVFQNDEQKEPYGFLSHFAIGSSENRIFGVSQHSIIEISQEGEPLSMINVQPSVPSVFSPISLDNRIVLMEAKEQSIENSTVVKIIDLKTKKQRSIIFPYRPDLADARWTPDGTELWFGADAGIFSFDHLTNAIRQINLPFQSMSNFLGF